MDDLETLYLTTRLEWRSWLSRNFRRKTEIWLIYPRRKTGKPRIEYNTAVEEALCFGWIDSTVKSLDGDHTVQRFSIRRPHSSFSQANKERIRWLFETGRIHPSVRPTVESIASEQYQFPPDILSRIQGDSLAWMNYQKFSEPYKRIRIAYIDSARKRPDEFEKRMENFLEQTRKNKLIRGFGGIDKYY